MIVAGTIFGISLLGIIFMLLNKMRQLSTGRAYISVSEHTNAKVQKISQDTALMIKNAPKVVAQTVAFLALKGTVIVYEKAKKKIYPKIAHLVDAVKGKDVPKNKGSASFFLTSIRRED
jgi:hypothetical protein